MATEESDKSASPENSDSTEKQEKPEKQEGTDKTEKSEKSGSVSPPPGPMRSNSGTSSANITAARRPQSITIPPPGMDELEETYAQRTEISVAPDKTIDDQIAELEAWASINIKLGRSEAFRIWALRGISFFASIGAATTAALSMTNEAVACGCIAALAVAIDTGLPAAGDRVARRRATHDLRELQHTLKLRWDKVRLAHPNPISPKRIAHALVLLDAISAKREEIGKFLGDASPGVSKSVGN
jgi:hypothetical protein